MLKKLDELKNGKTLYLNVLTNQTGSLSEHKMLSSAKRSFRDNIVTDKRYFNNNRKRTNGRTIQITPCGSLIRHETNPI